MQTGYLARVERFTKSDAVYCGWFLSLSSTLGRQVLTGKAWHKKHWPHAGPPEGLETQAVRFKAIAVFFFHEEKRKMPGSINALWAKKL